MSALNRIGNAPSRTKKSVDIDPVATADGRPENRFGRPESGKSTIE